jgi:nucleotide-binding universal stress UspA family protein
MEGFRTVVLTTDFSDLSRRAVPLALLLVRAFGSKLLVVHVVEHVLLPLSDEFSAVPFQELLDAQRRHAAQALDRFVDSEIRARGFEAEPLLCQGVPHVEIVRLAAAREADLIVMATHGRGSISQAVFGSTTERVLRHAPCPVLTVRGETTPRSA